MTVLSAQLMVGLYVVSLLMARRLGTTARRFRMCWTAACSVLTAHLLLAFHERHQWSWSDAVEHTTRVTERVIGTSSGLEIWFNVLFVSWWWIDMGLRWRAREQPLSKRYNIIVQVMWSFMLLNSTAVFGPTYWWWIVPVVVALLMLTSRGASADLERHRQ